jgi:hypothetical protein
MNRLRILEARALRSILETERERERACVRVR